MFNSVSTSKVNFKGINALDGFTRNAAAPVLLERNQTCGASIGVNTDEGKPSVT